MPEEDRATDIGNNHKNLVKIACVVPEISSPTDRHTDRHSSQYFATDPAGEVIRYLIIIITNNNNNNLIVRPCIGFGTYNT